MTEKFYLNNAYLRATQSTVLACEEKEDGYLVELDRTIFYPTGGGQPHDTGTIGGVAVTDVFERGERVLHAVSAPLMPGETVACEINWARRFDHMQQHSGEHLLSFAAKELFCAVNVGFHMADRRCTIDLDKPLTREAIEAIENRANALVFENLPVRVKYVDLDELSTLTLRKKAEGLAGPVRIVDMPGGDSCTCCGTHVAHTGEIGVIAVTAAEAHKGGVRLSFVCGSRALSYLQKTRGVLSDIARACSCGAEDIPTAVQTSRREFSSLKCENKTLQTMLVRALSRELRGEARIINGKRLIARFVDVPAPLLRPLATALCEAGDTITLLLAQSEEGVQYALCRSDGINADIQEITKYVNRTLQARGGGRGNLAQGSAPRMDNLEGIVERLADDMARRLEGL